MRKTPSGLSVVEGVASHSSASYHWGGQSTTSEPLTKDDFTDFIYRLRADFSITRPNRMALLCHGPYRGGRPPSPIYRDWR